MFGKVTRIEPRPCCIPLETIEGTPGQRGDYYISARVISHHLPTIGNRRRHGFIQWSIRCPDGQGGDVEFQRLEVPGGLNESAGSRSNRIYEANRQILGTVPFHDDIFFEIALSSIQSGGKFDPYLKLLADMSHVASSDSFISSFVPGISLVSKGLTYAAEQKESTPIELDVMCRFSFDGDTFKPGKYAAIYGPFDSSNSDALQLDEKSGQLFHVRNNRRLPINDCPYIIFSIDIEPSRSDWFRVPDILTAWQELRLEYVEGGSPVDIENAFRRFERICLSSPDLIRSDAQKLVTMMSELFERSPSTHRAEMAGISQPEMLGIKVAAAGARARLADLRKVSSLKQLLSVDRLSDLATRTYQHAANNMRQDQTTAGVPAEDITTDTDISQGVPGPLSREEERVFQRALSFAKGWEGGYVDHPSDHGGKTNFGIIQPTLNAYTSRKGLPPKSVRELSFEEAEAIYREDFFIAGKCEQLPEDIAVAYFDARINHSPKTAGKLLQKGINAQPGLAETHHVSVDGIVGPGTIAAARNGDERAILKGYCDAREAHFRHRAETVEGQDSFINGWLNRVNDLRRHLGLPVGEAFLTFIREALPKPADFLEYINEKPNPVGRLAEPLNQDEIKAAIAEISGNGFDSAAATADLISHIQSMPADKADMTATAILAELRARRAFQAIAGIANALMLSGVGGVAAWRHRAQALVELKKFDEAIWTAKEIGQRFASRGDEQELRTARTILARTSKQKYVDAAQTNPGTQNAADIAMAAQLYMDAYTEQRSSSGAYYYEGLNALAVLKRADKDSIPVLPHIDRDQLCESVENNARSIVDQKLTGRSDVQVDEGMFWAMLTLAETATAKRDLEAARHETQRALDHANVNNLFNLGAFSRQLREVWQLDREPTGSPWRALLNSIDLVIMRLSQNDVISLTKPQLDQLENNFDEKTFEHGSKRAEALLGSFKLVPAMAYIDYLKSVCSAIARIKSSTRPMAGSGTGFLMQGETLSPKWRGKTVLVTNFHVVSPDGVYQGSLVPEEAVASFTFLPQRPALAVGKVLWTSAFNAHDCTILEIDISDYPDLTPLKHFKKSPPANKTDPTGNPIGQVNVIGHPAGREMELGTTGLDLHEWTHTLFKASTGPPVPIPVLRYNSPTEPGSSGSPVFDMQSLELCALHHASLTYQREITLDRSIARPDLSSASGGPLNVRSGGYRNRISSGSAASSTTINQPANEGIWLAGIVDAIDKYPEGLI